VALTPVVGLAIAGLAIIFAEVSGKSSSLVLFSGQEALGPFLDNAGGYTVGTLVLLLMCKALAYAASLSCFRGGPIFPALFVGAVGGVALSHLPGLDPVAGAAMGMGAMTVVMLGFPLTAVLIATLLLGQNGLDVMPLVIIAVAVAYVASERLRPSPSPIEAESAAPPRAEQVPTS
jgi:H+/Cl- antiporter ClcA